VNWIITKSRWPTYAIELIAEILQLTKEQSANLISNLRLPSLRWDQFGQCRAQDRKRELIKKKPLRPGAPKIAGIISMVIFCKRCP
jgi:hypothetical protein